MYDNMELWEFLGVEGMHSSKGIFEYCSLVDEFVPEISCKLFATQNKT